MPNKLIRGISNETMRVIEARAAKIPDPAWRARYLDEIPEHVRARELGHAWLDRGLP